MYRFREARGPLGRLVTGFGRFENEPGLQSIVLSSDYAHEIVWRLNPNGSLEGGAVHSPLLAPLELEFDQQEARHTFSVRLRPETVRFLTGDAVSGKRRLDELSGPLRKLAAARTQPEVEAKLASLADGFCFDPTVMDALDRLRLGLMMPIEDQLAPVGYSYSQISRRFEKATGVSPRLFGRLRRLQRAKHLHGTAGHDVASSALYSGFADSSHLNHECRRLTGRSFRDFVAKFTLPD